VTEQAGPVIAALLIGQDAVDNLVLARAIDIAALGFEGLQGFFQRDQELSMIGVLILQPGHLLEGGFDGFVELIEVAD
jgi:hypothetical protein